jgi:hypothetical protein
LAAIFPRQAITVNVDVEHDRPRILRTISHAPLAVMGAEELLARRLIEAHGGQIETTGGQTQITLPINTITGLSVAPVPSQIASKSEE